VDTYDNGPLSSEPAHLWEIETGFESGLFFLDYRHFCLHTQDAMISSVPAFVSLLSFLTSSHSSSLFCFVQSHSFLSSSLAGNDTPSSIL
jgi:hypothetical protein